MRAGEQLAEALTGWVARRMEAEMGRVQARVAVFAPGAVEPASEIPLGALEVSPNLAAQVCAVVAREVPAENAIGVLLPATYDVINRAAGVPSDTGRLKQGGAMAFAAFRNRQAAAVLVVPDLTSPGRFTTSRMAPNEAGIPDWYAPGFRVAPAFEDQLARHKVPGAVRHAIRTEPVQSGETVDRDLILLGDAPDTAWETVNASVNVLRNLDPRLLTLELAIKISQAPIPGCRGADFASVVEHGWNTEAESVMLIMRFGPPSGYRSPDPAADIQVILDSPRVKPRVRTCLLMAAADAEASLNNFVGAWEIGAMVVETAPTSWHTMAASRLLYELWPASSKRKRRAPSQLDIVGINAACGFALWRVLRHMLTPRGLDFSARPADEDVAYARALVDALMHRLGVPPGDRASRAVALAANVLGAVDARWGEVRRDQWRKLIGANVAVGRQVVRHAAYHAIGLHSRLVLLRVAQGWDEPQAVDLRGCVYPQFAKSLQRLVLDAAQCSDRAAALALLETIRDAARHTGPGRATIDHCTNEGRFAWRDWSPELLSDLVREGGLAAHAEALRVAERLGEPTRVTRSLKQLKKLTAGGPHDWTVRALIGLLRPGQRDDLKLIGSLVAEAPGSAPTAGVRLTRALYQGDVGDFIERLKSQLGRRVAELTEAGALRQERLEELLTAPPPPRSSRPSVPLHETPGAVLDAYDALRWRLDRPFFRDHEAKAALEAHAKAVMPLMQADEPISGPWLEALGTEEVGLVAVLDALMREEGESNAWELVLADCDAALRGCLQSTFRQQVYSATADLEARGASAEQLAAVRGRVTGDFTDADADEVREALTELRAIMWAAARAAWVDENETSESEPGRPSVLMTLISWAIDRSLEELDTPSWAISAGLRQVDLYNRSGGHRDRKKLKKEAQDGTGLWELRHADSRRPLRVVYRHTANGPQVVAIMAKINDAHQRRLLARIAGWFK